MSSEDLHAAAQSTLDGLGDSEQADFDVGVRNSQGRPILIRIRRRGDRYRLDDQGASLHAARTPEIWFRLARSVAAETLTNTNRAGRLFFAGITRDQVWARACQLADASRTLEERLLEHQTGKRNGRSKRRSGTTRRLPR